jgi:hypothetical protein
VSDLAAQGRLASVVVGARVRVLVDIWDDGADHHPPGYLAFKGEELIVREVGPKWVSVSHADVTDSRFCIRAGEFEVLGG